MTGPGVARRLALTVALVYTIHFAPNVVRETYLAVALGDQASIRVDQFLGLHPDLFAIEGRGAYINSNPGASMLGAVPYALARPGIDLLLRLKPELAAPKPQATYDDPRPNRERFLNEARARGLDIKLGLAAVATHLGLMMPLAVLATLVMFGFLRRRLGDEQAALWLALLYAFGTPIFFRSAFLNQNAILAHLTLFAFVALADADPRQPRPAALAGLFMGLGLLCDYSAAPLVMVFGAWCALRAWRQVNLASGVRSALAFGLGAAGPVAVLLAYQWAAFGNPWLPAQSYMPATQLSARGWHGIAGPSLDLLWRNLLDPRFGLFAFSPMLVAGLAAPFLRSDTPGRPRTDELILIGAASLALWLFSSANQFAALQWNTGVRYLLPAGTLLFFALAPVLLRLSPAWRLVLVVPTLTISWAVSMMRESVPTSLAQLLLGGFQLPWLITLRKTAAAYAPFLEQGASPIALLLLVGVILWLIWRPAPGQAAT
jgi:hypothetical protein